MVQTPQGRVYCQKVLVAVDGRLEYLLPELKDVCARPACRF